VKLTLTIGDIPLAFVMTLTTTRPFTTQDQTLGVAYISIIIVWCFLTMFPFGGWMLVKRDFETPLVQSDVEARGYGRGMRWLSRVTGISMRRGTDVRVAGTNSTTPEDACVVEIKEMDLQTKDVKLGETATGLENRRHSTSLESVPDPDSIHPVLSHVSQAEDRTNLEDISLAATPSLSWHQSLITPNPPDPLYKRIGRNFLKFLWSLMSPPAIACLLSLLIALVPQLKALLVAAVPGVNIPDAPDGTPPLGWILDITNFGGWFLCVISFLMIGGASVPTGLIILGASLSTLSLRRSLPPW
jgi:auxin efflux carrier family protein